MSNILDFNEFLNLSNLMELSHEEKMKEFEKKAKVLGFTKEIIGVAKTRNHNRNIYNIKLEKDVGDTYIGVYFFYLSKSVLNKKDWDFFKNVKTKISTWNEKDKQGNDKNYKANDGDILYIGQRHENLVGRLREHTVKSNEGTQSLKLYEDECPIFEYQIVLFYQSSPREQKMRNKILCFMLEAIAKELFLTTIGK